MRHTSMALNVYEATGGRQNIRQEDRRILERTTAEYKHSWAEDS
jgi:hypothetical protein